MIHHYDSHRTTNRRHWHFYLNAKEYRMMEWLYLPIIYRVIHEWLHQTFPTWDDEKLVHYLNRLLLGRPPKYKYCHIKLERRPVLCPYWLKREKSLLKFQNLWNIKFCTSHHHWMILSICRCLNRKTNHRYRLRLKWKKLTSVIYSGLHLLTSNLMLKSLLLIQIQMR